MVGCFLISLMRSWWIVADRSGRTDLDEKAWDMGDKAQLAQARAANKWRVDVPVFNMGRVVMFRPARTPHKSQADCVGPVDEVALDPPVYHNVRMRVSGKLYSVHITDMRAYRIPIVEPERGKAHRCLSGTVYTNWLMYESPFKDAGDQERQGIVRAFSTSAEAASWQNGVNTYWHRWVALTHTHQHQRTESLQERDPELVAQHIGARFVPAWRSAIFSIAERNCYSGEFARRIVFARSVSSKER
ncbi:hypothetical protein SARC_00443 [Sphaeroforma arctica JP610]|uniref:Uncharacterized protein n=1 Tax=Sphaeroforma arctica JP610 TaxID=667725 RepID=A0A0L0GF17_9EUKA|nr:hypothetical protein SARC_00443 [Sphaeroforma arctica JP610]KNC87461.1 hypothetical protein SARC_00443 [Sphaeroforma arctica JP610]|eukprot:XP_014161363.1 hypothetical protein SARC_00443 [Sphaeroforma arctica JP610]